MRSRGISAVSGGGLEHPEIVIGTSHPHRHKEAAGGIEPPYGALQLQKQGSSAFA